MSNHNFFHGDNLSQSALRQANDRMMPGANATSYTPDQLGDPYHLKRWMDGGYEPIQGSEQQYRVLRAKAEVIFDDSREDDSSV